MPQVVSQDNTLYLEVVGGADANHEPRVFYVPISEAHLEVIKSDVKRHYLLWSAVLPLCEDAGAEHLIDEIAVTLLDPILFGSDSEVEAFLAQNTLDKRILVAHHASIELLDEGNLFAALESVTPVADWNIVSEYEAKRIRALHGTTLTPLDEAVLRYVGLYPHGGGLLSRKPENVSPELLPQVLEIILVGEQACAGMELSKDWGKDRNNPDDKKQWNEISNKASDAVRRAFPILGDEAARAVGSLMSTEARNRARL